MEAFWVDSLAARRSNEIGYGHVCRDCWHVLVQDVQGDDTPLPDSDMSLPGELVSCRSPRRVNTSPTCTARLPPNVSIPFKVNWQSATVDVEYPARYWAISRRSHRPMLSTRSHHMSWWPTEEAKLVQHFTNVRRMIS